MASTPRDVNFYDFLGCSEALRRMRSMVSGVCFHSLPVVPYFPTFFSSLVWFMEISLDSNIDRTLLDAEKQTFVKYSYLD